MCGAYGIEYLAMRVYIGIWLFVIAFFVSCVEGSVFVKVFTRFTEEIFASLICIIYIVESVMKLFKVRAFLLLGILQQSLPIEVYTITYL